MNSKIPPEKFSSISFKSRWKKNKREAKAINRRLRTV